MTISAVYITYIVRMEGYKSNLVCKKEKVYNIMVSLYNINRSCLKILCA